MKGAPLRAWLEKGTASFWPGLLVGLSILAAPPGLQPAGPVGRDVLVPCARNVSNELKRYEACHTSMGTEFTVVGGRRFGGQSQSARRCASQRCRRPATEELANRLTYQDHLGKP